MDLRGYADLPRFVAWAGSEPIRAKDGKLLNDDQHGSSAFGRMPRAHSQVGDTTLIQGQNMVAETGPIRGHTRGLGEEGNSSNDAIELF